MRLIDANTLEELFREVIGGIAKKPEINGNLEHMVRASAMVIEMIQDAPTIEPQRKSGRWIPCSERLPEGEVLCCDKRGEMIIGYPYQDDESNTGYSAVLDDVVMIDCIAWMPLPECYREGEG